MGLPWLVFSSLCSAGKHLHRDCVDASQPQAEPLSLDNGAVSGEPRINQRAGLCAPGKAVNLGHRAKHARLVPCGRKRWGFVWGPRGNIVSCGTQTYLCSTCDSDIKVENASVMISS